MTQPMGLRASSMDRLWGCAPSVLASGVAVTRISPDSDAAALGKFVHQLAAQWVTGEAYDLKVTAGQLGLGDPEIEDAARLMDYAVKAWTELKTYFPVPQVEAIIQSRPFQAGQLHYQLNATLDVLSPQASDRAIIADWKSGFLDEGFHHQMATGAYCTWESMGRPDPVSITCVVIFLRHRYYRVTKWDAASLQQWHYDLIHNVLSKPDSYRPGKQCRWCELYAGCRARQAVVSGTLDAIMFPDKANNDEYRRFVAEGKTLLTQVTSETKVQPMVGQVLGDLLFRVALAERAAEDVRRLIRATVERVGSIPLGDGTMLALRTLDIAKVDPGKALPILSGLLSSNQICQAMKLSLPILKTVYGNQQPKGKRTEAKEALEAMLDTGGAITYEPQLRLEVVEEPKPKEEKKDGEP